MTKKIVCSGEIYAYDANNGIYEISICVKYGKDEHGEDKDVRRNSRVNFEEAMEMIRGCYDSGEASSLLTLYAYEIWRDTKEYLIANLNLRKEYDAAAKLRKSLGIVEFRNAFVSSCFDYVDNA